MAPFRFRAHYNVMKNKINRTGIIITGAAALLAGPAGSVQAVPMPVSDVRGYQATHSTVLSKQDQSIAEPADPLSPQSQRTAASLELSALPVRNGRIIVSTRPSSLVDENRSPLSLLSSYPMDLPNSRGTALTTYYYHIPTPVMSRPPPGRPVVPSSSSKATVPDGGSTVMLLGIAFSGVVLLHRKLSAKGFPIREA
jgi:hypothetical protein